MYFESGKGRKGRKGGRNNMYNVMDGKGEERDGRCRNDPARSEVMGKQNEEECGWVEG